MGVPLDHTKDKGSEVPVGLSPHCDPLTKGPGKHKIVNQ